MSRDEWEYLTTDCFPDEFASHRDTLTSVLLARGVDPGTLIVGKQLQLFSPKITLTVKGQRKKTSNA